MEQARILVVEDEAIIARDLRSTLERLGYEVVGIEASGEGALRTVGAGARAPDLVLMDIRLGGTLDGIETAIRLRARHGVPSIFVSGLLDHQAMARIRTADPYGCLVKPIDERELHAAVEVALARIHAERGRRGRDQELANAVASMADAVITADLAGFVTYLNPSAEQLTGWTLEAAVGRPLGEVFRITLPSGESAAYPPANDSEPAHGHSADEPSGGRAVVLTTRSGDLVMVEDATAAVTDRDGGLSGQVIVFRPRADSRLVEAADPSWAHLVGIVESIEDPLFAIDSHWRITYANRQAARYIGRKREELAGADLWSVIPKSIQSACQPHFYGSLLHREARSFELHQESRSAWFDVHTYPFGDGLLVLFRDISARKSAEEQRTKVEKLESLGLLARGFAHDFNNLLTILLGNLSLASLRLPDDSPARNELETARNATLHAQNLVQQLLTFARGGAPIKQPTDLAELVAETLRDHRRQPGIDYRVEIDDALTPVELDPHQIKRLLINLIRNAEEASPGGGTIAIRCHPETEPPGEHDHVDEGRVEHERRLVLEVEDKGAGIRRTDLPHVFEPYFSTRTEANASGIGLTVCESIARGHNGSISIHSEEGKGTRVTIVLPSPASLTEPGAESAGIQEESEVDTSDRTRRILVLEDEPLIRQLAAAQLAGAGYEVDTTADGKETVRRYREALEAGRRYDLLILDLTIPNGMGGARAISEILEIDPGAIAVVSSGYSDDPAMAYPDDYGFRAVLPKPYEPKALNVLVDRLLGRRRPA